jgi:hypothetical protein
LGSQDQVVIVIGSGELPDRAVALAELLAFDGTTLTIDRAGLGRVERLRAVTGRNCFRREGGGWTVAFAGVGVPNLGTLKGLEDIHLLLSNQSRPVPITELIEVGVVAGGAPLAEVDTVLALRTMLKKHDVRDADVERYLRSVTRLDGTPRFTASNLAKAVSAVRNRLDRAVRHISRISPGLANHLDRSIHKGLTFSYRPAETTAWEL